MATRSGARWRSVEDSNVISSDESDIDNGEEMMSDEELPAVAKNFSDFQKMALKFFIEESMIQGYMSVGSFN